MNASKGYGLLDLLLALAIIGIVALLSAPRFSELTDRATPVIESERLLAAIWAARHAAITQGKPVTMKARDNHWSNGWMLFVDENHNGLRESDEPLLQVADPIARQHQLVANSGIGLALSYLPHGESRRPGGGLQMGTFTLCSPGIGNSLQPKKAIVISATGRPRTVHTEDSLNAAACDMFN